MEPLKGLYRGTRQVHGQLVALKTRRAATTNSDPPAIFQGFNTVSVTQIRPGEAFNPYRQFNGVFIPEALLSMPDVPAAAKLLYGQLSRHAGRDGNAYPSYGTLAKALGIEARQAMRLAHKLSECKLIEIRKRADDAGRQRSNGFIFLWHEAFEARIPEVQIEGDIVDLEGDEPGTGEGTERDTHQGTEHVTQKRVTSEESHKEQQQADLEVTHSGAEGSPPPAAECNSVDYQRTLTSLRAKGFPDAQLGQKWETEAKASGYTDEQLAATLQDPRFDPGDARKPPMFILRAADFLKDAGAADAPMSQVESIRIRAETIKRNKKLMGDITRRRVAHEEDEQMRFTNRRARKTLEPKPPDFYLKRGHLCDDPDCVDEFHIEIDTTEGELVKVCAWCSQSDLPGWLTSQHKRFVELRLEGIDWPDLRAAYTARFKSEQAKAVAA